MWDLQVHTPFSELNNGFGGDHDLYAAQFFSKAIEKHVSVVGVTDYFSVDGFKFLKAIQEDDARLAALIGHDKVEAAKAVKLLPNVELRTDILVDGNRVNFHVIFSDEVCTDDITDNFLAQLNFTSEGNPQGLDQQLALTRKNLEDLGRTLKQQHTPFADKSDLFIGMMTATVSHQQVSKILGERSSKFGNKYLFCLPCDEDLSSISWDGQGHVVRKVLIQKAHLLFSSNKNTRDFALGRKHPSPEDYIREFLTFKPCVHGSDAHRPEELFEPAESRYTWIKADPTFMGLLQTLNEPDGRVYVGSCPPSLEAIRSRPTKVITDIGVHKKSGATLTEKWFDHQVPLNPELIAIIGNKGSGKSALADILGLIGNTPRFLSFSFLSPDRFRDRKNNKAKHFEASATWADDKTDGPISLDDTPAAGSVETVKYIPQDYLETICNEVSLGSGSNFYAELQNVIFSHVPEEERLGFSTLDELLEHRSEETQKSIAFLVDQLREINREIVAREEQLTDAHRKTLESHLAAKQRELDAHDTAKPAAMAPPSEDSEGAKMAAIGAELQNLQAELAKEEGRIGAAKQRLAGLAKRRSTAKAPGKALQSREAAESRVVRCSQRSRGTGPDLERAGKG